MSAEELFTAASGIANPVERAAYLARACGGDETLRREVESLLAVHERAGDFLQQPPPAVVQAGFGGLSLGGPGPERVVVALDPARHPEQHVEMDHRQAQLLAQPPRQRGLAAAGVSDDQHPSHGGPSRLAYIRPLGARPFT